MEGFVCLKDCMKRVKSGILIEDCNEKLLDTVQQMNQDIINTQNCMEVNDKVVSKHYSCTRPQVLALSFMDSTVLKELYNLSLPLQTPQQWVRGAPLGQVV